MLCPSSSTEALLSGIEFYPGAWTIFVTVHDLDLSPHQPTNFSSAVNNNQEPGLPRQAFRVNFLDSR